MAITTPHAVERFVLDGRIRQRWQPATRRLYRSRLMRLAHWLTEQQDVIHIEEVTTNHLRAFISAPQNRPVDAINPRTPAAAGVHAPAISAPQFYVRIINVIFGWLEEKELIPQNPALALHPPQPTAQQRIQQPTIQTLHPEHIEALFAACDCTTSQGLRDYVLMLLLLETGLRVRELCGLTLNQLYEDHLSVVVSKGNTEREVGFFPATGKLIRQCITLHRVAAEAAARTLFTDAAGRPLDPSGVGKLLRRVRDAAGLEDVPVTAHLFRQTVVVQAWHACGAEAARAESVAGSSSGSRQALPHDH